MRAIKLIGIILIIVIISTCCAAAGLYALAAVNVVYFDNSVSNMNEVYCYMWGNSGTNAGFPGEKMVNITGNIWAYEFSGDYSNLIFSHGNSDFQSINISIPGSGQIAVADRTTKDFNVSWSAYTGSQTLPTSSTQPQSSSQNTSESSSTPFAQGAVYCLNESNWSAVYCYMWNDLGNNNVESNANWPGVKMTPIGDNVWEYIYNKNFKNVIFNSGSETNKTTDLVFPGNGSMYNNKTGQWDYYSPSPLKISSFTTSLESPSYIGCNITIFATAKSSASDSLNYKFKAQKGTGTTLLYSGKLASVVWVPESAGTYTLTVEVSDGAENTASRSISFTVNNPADLVQPYVRAFYNSFGTSYQIEKNTPVTFTNDAIGGNTGNGLLFYKYMITSPSGEKNTAYYTTSKSYTYTPSELGLYTVKAYVQNSDNTTLINTYTYTSVNSINENQQDSSSNTTASSQQNPEQKLRGDANGNGEITIDDVTWIQLYLVKTPYYLQRLNKELADVTGDGIITIQDANMIQRYKANMIDSL